MNALDACPDDLLARAPDAPLAPAERALLEAHLGRCASCRTAAAVGAALRDEPITLPGDERLVARLAARAAGGPRAVARRWRPGRAAVVVLVAGAAVAGLWGIRRVTSPPVAPGAIPVPTPSAPAAAPEVEAPRPVGRAIAAAEAPPSGAPADRPAPPRRRAVAHESFDVDALLAQARRARAESDGRRALELYRRVTRVGRGTPAAAVAEIAIGVLLLEPGGGGDARGALDAFDRYLATSPSGALQEEAIAGRARALEALGERARAIAAWRELLDAHPRSLQAPLARRRLAALGAALPPETP